MLGYYDYDGNPIDIEEWSLLLEARHNGEQLTRWRVGLDKVGEWAISTVWLGLDHDHFDVGVPLIFETMAFHADTGHSELLARYPTAEAAERGHAIWCHHYAIMPPEAADHEGSENVGG